MLEYIPESNNLLVQNTTKHTEAVTSLQIEHDSSNLAEPQIRHIDYPATWPTIMEKIKCCLVEHGPEQTNNTQFPLSGNRCFSKIWFDKILTNGEKLNRH